jgi:hypothetical protein
MYHSRRLSDLKSRHMTSGAVLRIEVKQRGPFCRLVFRAGGRTLNIISSVPWDSLPDASNEIRAALESFHIAVGDALHISDWPMLDSAVAEFDKTGNALLFRLLGRKGTLDLYDFLRKRAPSLMAVSSEGDGPIPVVELDSAGNYIHFEVLPLLGAGGRPKITSRASLRRAMVRFLGMASIIRRALKPPHPDLRLRSDDKLPIKFFRDRSLPGSATEGDFFKRDPRFDLDGPWPTGWMSADGFADQLALFLAKPGERFNGTTRDPVDQIHHISCHCYIGEEMSSDNRLDFSNEHGSYSASLRDLQAAYGEIFRTARRRQPSPPLVFLNACTSVSVEATKLCSFPSLFLESHRGVIGTETRIPDEVAAEFSTAFYRFLLDGKTVGESLYLARWHLVKKANNPLGLVYTLYADPNLYVPQSETTRRVTWQERVRRKKTQP